MLGDTMTIAYQLPNGRQRLVLGSGVLAHVISHRQMRRWRKEAGGQLFARFEPGRAVVERVTGPRRTDRRTRTTYLPDRAAEQREIREMHAEGFHYVGDWHTHPERFPQPSALDRMTMVEMFEGSVTQAEGFLLLIVGTGDPPAGLHVAWANRGGLTRLFPAREADAMRVLGTALFSGR